MMPRGASTRTVRSWLFSATRRYWCPARISSAHSRRKSAPKTTTAIVPRIATRSASCGVRRYGSAVRGSGGRKLLLAKQPHLVRAVAPRRRTQELFHEPVDGRREDEVERDRRHERVEQHAPHGDGIADEEVQQHLSDGVQNGDDGDRHERCVRAVASGRLTVASDP